MPLQLDQIIHFVNKSRDKLLKIAQYICLLIAYYHENRDHKAQRYEYYFKYKDIFNIRRLFRVGNFINFIPEIIKNLRELGNIFSMKILFLTISNILKCLFYLVDNTAIIMSLTERPKYYIARRVSFTLFWFYLLSTLVYNSILLQTNYNKERQLKSPANSGKLLPQQFLDKITQLDNQKVILALNMGSCLGNLIPTLQRINLNQIILKTRMHKGPVGWSGLIAAICELISINKK